MKTIYKCEVCDRTHDTTEEANVCETGHNIIEVKWWWLIPFVGWFMVPISLFTKKNAIIKPKNFKERMKLDLVIMGPILFLCLVMLIYTQTL